MNIRDRLLSRASVAVMAAFAPDGLPPGAERVEDTGSGNDGDAGGMDSLSPQELADFEAMRSGQPSGDDNVESASAAGDDAAGEDDDGTGGDADGRDADNGAPSDKQPDSDAGEPGAGGEKRQPKTINYGRHQKMLAAAEKEKADLQARLEAAEKAGKEAQEQRARLDERTKLLLEAINTKQPPAPASAAAPKDEDPEPDAEADPLAHIQWTNRRLAKQVEELTSGRKKEQELTAAEQEEKQVYGEFVGTLENAARADETYGEAFVHLRETRYRELGFIYAGIDVTDPAQCAKLTPQQQVALSDHIQRAFYNEQIMTARAARQAGFNPAEVVRNLAVARGYQPKAKEAAPQDPPADPPVRANGKGNGTAAPRAPAAPPVSVSEQLDQIRQNQRDAKSLSDAGGAPGGDITVERLATMSDDEFLAFYESMPKDKFDRIMGKVPQ